MTTIQSIQKKYSSKLDLLDLELLIAAAIHKPREFVLAHPEFSLNSRQRAKIDNLVKRRMKSEPLAYILGHREFFGLDFSVNKHTIIPRPETELIVEKVLELKPKNRTIVDIGTGSGNIIISLTKNIRAKNNYIALDISKNVLRMAKKNAATHKIDKKIKFIQSNLLSKLNKECFHDLIVVANLPYLSSKIYSKVSLDVKKYEPKSALYSEHDGLDHYEKLFKQVKFAISHQSSIIIFLEFSPEQKNNLNKLIRKYFSKTKPIFHKDLAGKWRICEFHFQ